LKEFVTIIPAIKKNGNIPDQLIKKLNGKTLIQRAIDTAKELNSDIYIITDSQEISLIADRNDIKYIYNASFKIDGQFFLKNMKKFLDSLNLVDQYQNILIYRASTPLVTTEKLLKAYEFFLNHKDKVLVSVKQDEYFFFDKDDSSSFVRSKQNSFKEINSFMILTSEIFQNESHEFYPFIIEDEFAIEINTYQDWWISEKLLQRQKIIFNVIGSIEIGMGHIYRSLALAHEITNHEVIFVCDAQYQLAVTKIASMDYKIISTNDVLNTILSRKPNLVINDVLDTEEDFILNLKQKNIKVVNFEDFGTGSKLTNITINELFEEPILNGSNYLWGHQYYFLRDEFNDARPHKFVEKVSSVLISFGGTDQNNLTLVTLKAIIDLAKTNNLIINIVCGGGYIYKDDLIIEINKLNYSYINLTFASGVISKIMENSQIAISSNGRTVYELADMHIPSIIIAQHERELTHSFPKLETGFINLGVFRTGIKYNIINSFQKLIEDNSYRELLFLNIKKYSFRNNKQKVVKKILGLL